MKKAYYITQHTKPLPMHTVKAKFVHSTADTKRFSFQSKKSHTFYKKNHSRKFHPFLTEKIVHIGRPKLYTTINKPVSEKHTQRLTILSSTISDIEPRED